MSQSSKSAPLSSADRGLARSPATVTPPRTANSIRRTSHIDMIRTGKTTDDGVCLVGAARDTITAPSGDGQVLAEASVRAIVGPERILEQLTIDPASHDVSPLLGRAVGRGFRAAVDETVPQERNAQTPLYLLLDDLPVAALISGYADLYVRNPDQPDSEARQRARSLRADICAGWASDATMMLEIERVGRIPTPIGPAAPRLERDDDPLGWHPIGDLGPGSMRRRRRIDAIAGETLAIDAMFRDSHVDADGLETVLHEYSLEAVVDPTDLVVLSCEATARVLPWTECPRAATSGGRLVGQRVDALRGFVRNELVGTTTCTHLNDLLRSLADIIPLARALAKAGDSQ
jgi:hypothetical protein